MDDADFEWLSTFRWFRGGQCKRTKGENAAGRIGYATTVINNKLVKMDKLLMPRKPGLVVDHINRNPLDNRRNNLRYLTHGQNLQNATMAMGVSGFRGVLPHSRRPGIYSVWANVNGRRYWVGNFKDKLTASRARIEFVANGERNPASLPPVIRNTSGVRGVSPKGRKWVARKMVKGKSQWLGEFDTIEEAAAARKAAL